MQYANVYCKEKGMWTGCSIGGEIYEKEKPRTVFVPLNAATIYWFDTRTHNLADVSSFSPCTINLLLRIVESGSALATNLTSRSRSSNSQLVMHKICSHFATSWDSWGLVRHFCEAVSKLTAWNLPCCHKCNLEAGWKNNRSYHWLQCMCSQ